MTIDINAEIDATILIVSHNINLARTVPDNIGMLFRRKLVMFGPREVLLTSNEPVVEQFLNGTMIGPIAGPSLGGWLFLVVGALVLWGMLRGSSRQAA